MGKKLSTSFKILTRTSLLARRILLGLALSLSLGAIWFWSDGKEEDAWGKPYKIITSDGAKGDFFARGSALDIAGNFAVIGAYGDDEKGSMSGSAYIFSKQDSGWIQKRKILAYDGEEDDQFGMHVAISNDFAIIGSPGDDDFGPESGSVYIYKFVYGEWVLDVKLNPKDGSAYDNFGKGVDIYEDYAIVGAYGDDDMGSNSGSVYFFERRNGVWLEVSKIRAMDGEASDYFGRDGVALYKERALVSAYGDDDRGNNAGAAYVLERIEGNWQQTTKLVVDQEAAGDFIGRYGSVALYEDWALLGASGDDGRGMNSGAAYLFRRVEGEWKQFQKLVSHDGQLRDYFGRHVAISGNYALIGAMGDDDRGVSSGSAYLYAFDGSQWNLASKFIPEKAETSDFVGCGIALDKEFACLGAYGDDDNGANSGSAYFFELEQPNANQLPPAKPEILRGDQ